MQVRGGFEEEKEGVGSCVACTSVDRFVCKWEGVICCVFVYDTWAFETH